VDKRAAALVRLFEGIREGVLIGTLAPGSTSTIVANAYLKQLFGYPADTPDRDVRPFDEQWFVDPQARTALLDRLRADGHVIDHLLRLRRADRSTVWVELTALARTAAANAVRIEGLIRDVSARMKREDETRDLHNQLLQAEKMAALGQTISGVAHELNNPLATILSWAERLADRPASERSIRGGLETIRSEAERAARIVRNLLTFARKRQTTRLMVDVNQVVRETLALRAYDQRLTNISIIDALAAGLPLVFADSHQLQQVLLNLILNAEQAVLSASDRGALVVRTWHSAEREAVVLEINDDGPGVPEELQPKIFDPFFTTKEAGKGTGLGLTVAYAIVQEHGGRIRLESRPSVGASFFVELPVAGGRLTPGAAAPAPGIVQPVSGAAVLVVEDEAPLAAAVTDALRDAGYVVAHASDGEQALAMLHRQSFDAVICDLKMPRLDGKAFYRSLAECRPALSQRVVFVTGDVAAADAAAFFDETGCRWLAKPFRLSDLLRTLREVMA
jgi:two-component system NtrC family sensor kinase